MNETRERNARDFEFVAKSHQRGIQVSKGENGDAPMGRSHTAIRAAIREVSRRLDAERRR